MDSMNRALANGCKMISIWRNPWEGSFSVAACDEPHLGFRIETFDRQKDAIAFAEREFPGMEIWKETTTHFVKIK